MNVAYNIKKHKGTIDVESTVGEGTTFTIRIPVGLKIEGIKNSVNFIGYQLKAGRFSPFWLYCRVMREISYQALVIPAKPVLDLIGERESIPRSDRGQAFLTTSVLLDSRLRGNDGHICDTI